MEHVIFDLIFMNSFKRSDLAKIVESSYDVGLFHPEYGKGDYPFRKKKDYLGALVKSVLKAGSYRGSNASAVKLVMNEDQFEKLSKLILKINKRSKTGELISTNSECWFDEVEVLGKVYQKFGMFNHYVLECFSEGEFKDMAMPESIAVLKLRILSNGIDVSRNHGVGLTMKSLLTLADNSGSVDEAFQHLPISSVQLLSRAFGGKAKAVDGVINLLPQPEDEEAEGEGFEEQLLRGLFAEQSRDWNMVLYSAALAYQDLSKPIPDWVKEDYNGHFDIDIDEVAEDEED